MRILTIAASLPAPGAPAYGVDAVFAPIVRHLVDAGHDVWVLTVESASVPSAGAPTVWPWLIRDCPDPDVLPAQWTATHKLQYLWKMRRNYRATRRALRLSKPDVVYYSDLGLLTAAPVGAVEDAGHPGVFHAHDWYALDLLEGARQPTPDGGVKGMVLSWAQRGRRPVTIGGARLLANSHYVMDRYVEAGWLPEMAMLVYNGIGDQFFVERQRDEPQQRSVLFAGRCVPDKGLHVAVEALGNVVARHSDVELHAIGTFRDDAYRRTVEAAAKAHGVADRLVFRGYVPRDDMPAEYSRHLCTVVPSLWDEPFGLVSVESQAAGTPAIVSRRGGLPETVRDGETGIAVEPGDATALAEAIGRLLSDGALWGHMSRAGAEFVRDQFRIEDTCARVEQHLRAAADAGA